MLRSVYPLYPELVEWMNHNLIPMEQPVFDYYKGIYSLVRVVDRVERGDLPKYAALSAIRNYNDRAKTSITYEEIRDRSPNYVFHDFGQWAAYMDNVEASNALIGSPHTEPDAAFENAPEWINWILVLLPSYDRVIVYRSPHTAYRILFDEDTGLAEGMTRGQYEAFVLPPTLEASLGWSDPEEIFAAAAAAT